MEEGRLSGVSCLIDMMANQVRVSCLHDGKTQFPPNFIEQLAWVQATPEDQWTEDCKEPHPEHCKNCPKASVALRLASCV